MKIPTWALAVFLTAAVAEQGWLANSVHQTQTDVATIRQRLDDMSHLAEHAASSGIITNIPCAAFYTLDPNETLKTNYE